MGDRDHRRERLGTWSRIVAARSIDTVRVLQAADPGQAKITTDIGTNSFLFFAVK